MNPSPHTSMVQDKCMSLFLSTLYFLFSHLSLSLFISLSLSLIFSLFLSVTPPPLSVTLLLHMWLYLLSAWPPANFRSWPLPFPLRLTQRSWPLQRLLNKLRSRSTTWYFHTISPISRWHASLKNTLTLTQRLQKRETSTTTNPSHREKN